MVRRVENNRRRNERNRLRRDEINNQQNARNAARYERMHCIDYKYLGEMNYICQHCGAKKFPDETHFLCCHNKMVVLPQPSSFPQDLEDLLKGTMQIEMPM